MNQVTPLPGSGSNRKYYRLTDGERTCIKTVGTDADENAAFIYLARHFRSKGLRVPEIYEVSPDGMTYLQEDLGGTCLLDLWKADPEGTKGLLAETVSALAELQFRGAEGLDFGRCYPEPAFDRRLVMADLNYFKYCFLKLSGLEFNEVLLESDFEKLCEALLAAGDGQDTFMCRDFQSRNVMVKDGVPYFIDFQGGRKGPIYYDLASFLWQARAAYPDDLKERLIDVYLDAAGRFLGPVVPSPEEFRSTLRLFVLFRTLQVLGAYGFRGLYERKTHFLVSIPSALAGLRRIVSDPPIDCPYLMSVLSRLVGLPKFAVPTAASAPVAQAGSATGTSGAPVTLTVRVCSFSYKKGVPTDPSGNGGGYVFDCRALPNPGRYEEYRKFTGMDAEVIEFFRDKPQMPAFLDNAYALADAHVETFLSRGFTHMMICFGCTGGQHRSVYCAENMARHLAQKYKGLKIIVEHIEQGICRQ